MADPVTIALIAGGGLAVTSQIQQGRIASAQGDFEKKVQARNQQALNRQAQAEKDAAAIDEQRISRKSKIIQAQLSAGQAKSGIGLAGATIESLSDAAFQFSLDRNLTLRRGLIRSRELRQKGSILAAQGKFSSITGRATRNSLFMGAAGTALLTAGTIGSLSGGTPLSPDSALSSQSGRQAIGSSTRNFPQAAFIR